MGAQEDATFSDALKAALGTARYSQAKMAKELGVDPGQVSRWVNGKSVPHLETVQRIEAMLGTDLSFALASTNTGHELYISAPITGLGQKRIKAHHDAVSDVVESLRRQVHSVYWPGERIEGFKDLQAADLATERNLQALAHSSAYVFLQFSEILKPSSALVEFGIALGRRMKTTAIIQADLYQPFMFEGFGAVAASLPFLPKARIYVVNSVDDACELIDRNGRELLGLG
jgi:transcriptional regulator with XRE-family HTH domain